jgi:2-dehydro-3-deoxygalactonokinase
VGRIIVDWGSSNFRAYRFDAKGDVAETRQAQAGILTVQDKAFETVLQREIGDWITPGAEILLSGMITSRNGWLETPYVETPASLDQLAAGARTMALGSGATLSFLPGVAARKPMPDVMRGEEIQVFGTVGDASAVCILPGTHSKWVQTERGRITEFRTFLTGETYALLVASSIIGRLIPAGAGNPDEAALRAGVAQAFSGSSAGLLNDVFTCRSGALLGEFPVEQISERLSGILIGHEIRSGLALGWDTAAMWLVGDVALCKRYQVAFEAIGKAARLGPAHATVEGFRRLAGRS